MLTPTELKLKKIHLFADNFWLFGLIFARGISKNVGLRTLARLKYREKVILIEFTEETTNIF